MKDWISSLILTFLTVLLFGILYPLLIWSIGQISPEKALGSPILKNGKIIGFENIGQQFDSTIYFWSRPSAVAYNAASTGGSNQGPSNPAHLKAVEERLTNFLKVHSYLKKSEVPVEMLTTSGGGLDPHISPKAALIQVKRVAKIRRLEENKVKNLVNKLIEKPYWGFLGTEKINVLKLNLALDDLK